MPFTCIATNFGLCNSLVRPFSNYVTQCFLTVIMCPRQIPVPCFNINMLFYRYRKSHFGDKTVVRSSYLHNRISYTGKMAFLYWIRDLDAIYHTYMTITTMKVCNHIMWKENAILTPPNNLIYSNCTRITTHIMLAICTYSSVQSATFYLPLSLMNK